MVCEWNDSLNRTDWRTKTLSEKERGGASVVVKPGPHFRAHDTKTRSVVFPLIADDPVHNRDARRMCWLRNQVSFAALAGLLYSMLTILLQDSVG